MDSHRSNTWPPTSVYVLVMNKMQRIERHVRLAMANHLGEGDIVESAVFGHAEEQKNGEAVQDFFGESEDAHMVVSNRRVFVVQFGKPFPVKKGATVEPAIMISNRVKLVDEQIWFPRSFNDLDTVQGQTSNTQVNGWLFHPARMGITFDSAT